MQFQRVSPTQLIVDGPLDAVREAAWHALWNAGNSLPVIDVAKNVVTGTKGDGILTAVRVMTAQFESRPEGVIVSFKSNPVIGGTIDFGAGYRQAQNLVVGLERILASGFSPASSPQVAPSGPVAAPLADPSGGGRAMPLPGTMARPFYGPALAPKRGTTILVYGFLSLLLCQILAPITVIYGFGALKDYKRNGDPGDKGLVVAGMTIAALVTLGWIAFFGLVLFGT